MYEFSESDTIFGMGMIVVILVLVASAVLVFPYFTGQGLLYWQSKTSQLGRTALTCQYIHGVMSYTRVFRYEAWAHPNMTCDFLVAFDG